MVRAPKGAKLKRPGRGEKMEQIYVSDDKT